MTPPLLQDIGRFRVERVIGRGAMGIVYKAHDPVLDRPVAIKLVLAELLEAADGEDFLVRFRREAQAAGRCMHPNIVAVYDFAVHDGAPFLAMEFVEGTSLAQHLSGQAKLPIADAAAIVLQILDALESAHALGIVHRDIKPANILLTEAGRVKVTDFGIARLSRSNLTHSGAIVGTLNYMSPEQCAGAEVDQRADLFSTSAILHEMLLGRRPFPGANEMAVMKSLLGEEPFVAKGADLTPALLQVLTTGLAKRPERRFASATLMAAALREALAAATDQDRTIVLPRPGATFSGPANAAVSPATVAVAQKELARFLGPIAAVLVRRALPTAASAAELWQSLATHVETPRDREAFLRSRPS